MKSYLISYTNSIISFLSDLVWASEKEKERGMLVVNEDMIEEILLRLPVKTLVRCKSVSKKWHHLISESPSFRRIYFSRMKEEASPSPSPSPHMLGFFCSRFRDRKDMKSPVRFVATCKEGLMLKRGEETWGAPPFDPALTFMPQGNLNIMASSGGFLLCSLQVKCPRDYFICNPITKQWIALPKPTSTSYVVVHGFAICQDEPTASYLPLDLVKYKVFRVIWLPPGPRQPASAAVVEIFSSELNQWKTSHLNSTLPCSGPLARDRMVMALEEEDGVIAFYSSTLTTNNVVAAVVYDPRKDYLDIIEVPGGQLECGSTDGWGLSQGRIHYARHDWSCFQIWTLDKKQEYTRREWSLKQTVNIHTPMQNYTKLHGPLSGIYFVVAIHPTNPHLLFLSDDSKILLFNTQDSTIKLVFKGWKMTYNFFLYAWPHWPPFFP